MIQLFKFGVLFLCVHFIASPIVSMNVIKTLEPGQFDRPNTF